VPILDARHDFPHPVEPDPAWSESWYFNAFAPTAGTGFVTRIGIRPHEGFAHAFVVFWLPGGGASYFEERRPERSIVDASTTTAHVRIERIEPMRWWRVRIGPLPAEGRRIAIDARFEALGPAIGIDRAGGSFDSHDQARAAVRRSLASGHLEQPGKWTGTIDVDGERFALDGFGNRDKSWGPRDTAGRGLKAWRWFSINIGAATHLGGIRAITEDGELHRGWVQDGGVISSVRRWDLETTLAADGLTHRALVLDVRDRDGRLRKLQGRVERIVEIGIGEAAGLKVLEGLTRYELDGREGYGIAEYAHAIDNEGRPAVPVT
jgi:hypothetical protein